MSSRAPRQRVVISCVLLAAGMAAWLLTARSAGRVAEGGFWFEPTTYSTLTMRVVVANAMTRE